MRHEGKELCYGTQWTGILLTFLLGIFTCLGMATAWSAEPDSAMMQDCLFNMMRTSPSELTIDELRTRCKEGPLKNSKILFQRDCFWRSLRSAPGDTTVGEIETICRGEMLESTHTSEIGFGEERLYADDENILRPFTLMSHKPNFLLLAKYDKNPNEDPWHGAKTSSDKDLDNVEAEFQVSVKVPLAIGLFDSEIDIYAGYTVRSYWQVYNNDFSAFFRETNYAPEGWVQFRSNWSFWGIENVVNQFGIIHQSNGRDEPLSRSWNRGFANFIFAKGELMFGIRPWYRLPEDDEDDNNKDITDYLGHYELTASYRWNKNTFSIMSRNNLESGFSKGALEASWSFPLWNYKYLRGYIQGFTGYGQSLLDYDSNQTSVGVGLSVIDFI